MVNCFMGPGNFIICINLKSDPDVEVMVKCFIRPGDFITCTSSTAQGGGGSFENRKPIGEIGCCESGMAERIH